MIVEYKERVRRKYDVQRREQWRVNGGSTKVHSLGWRKSCVVERRGKDVHREAETKYGRRKRWRRQWGETGSMEDDRMH